MRPCRLPTIFNHWRRAEDGAMAIEFAMIAPVLLTLLFGIMEFGHAMFVTSSIENAVTTASRQAMIDENITPTELSAAVKSELKKLGIGDGQISVRVTFENDVDIQFANIQTSFQHELIMPLVSGMAINLNSTRRVPQGLVAGS